MNRRETNAKKNEAEEQLRKNPVNQFTCCDKAMNFDNFKKHLLEDHKLKEDQLKGKKSMLMHMDGDYWFSWKWQWELETGLKFTQYTMTARDKNDPMR